jgi:hypothetical protein
VNRVRRCEEVLEKPCSARRTIFFVAFVVLGGNTNICGTSDGPNNALEEENLDGPVRRRLLALGTPIRGLIDATSDLEWKDLM